MEDKTHSDRVLLPCETKSWDSIAEVLKRKISNVAELAQALSDITGEKNARIVFFKNYFSTQNDTSKVEETGLLSEELFFSEVLPFIQSIALKMPELFPKGLQALLPNVNATIVLTREQVACIIAHAFLCTFDRTSPIQHLKLECPELTYALLIGGVHSVAPMECTMYYFYRIMKKMPQGNIIVTRQVLAKKPDWASSQKPIAKVKVMKGLIEDSDAELHVDFANQFIGGGVLTGGNVQEEILFVIKPECLCTLLFCPKMEVNEAILITGAEHFSKYKGYGRNWQFDGPFKDTTPFDLERNALKRTIVAIDAMVAFSGNQFSKQMFIRDLDKAYIGFYDASQSSSNSNSKAAVASGNWGCGAFGGDFHLKILQQIMAASEAEREFIYCTFDKEFLIRDIETFMAFVEKHKVTVGQLYNVYLSSINLFDKFEQKLLPFLMARYEATYPQK